MTHLFAYQPTVAFDARIDEFGTLVTDWDDERLYELDVGPFDDEFNDWIRTQTCETELIARSRDIGAYGSTDDQLTFSDIRPDLPVTEVVEQENPGGDIRKYLNSLYGGVDASIDFALFRTTEPRITGFEPLSMEAVETLRESGYGESGIPADARYPTAEQVLDWATRTTAAFDAVNCGALGSLHLTDNDIRVGVNGFVIYDADAEVVSWAEDKWLADAPSSPFLQPSEFHMYEMGETPFGFGSVIRMWWD